MAASVNFTVGQATFRSASGQVQTVRAPHNKLMHALKLARDHSVGQAYAYLKRG